MPAECFLGLGLHQPGLASRRACSFAPTKIAPSRRLYRQRSIVATYRPAETMLTSRHIAIRCLRDCMGKGSCRSSSEWIAVSFGVLRNRRFGPEPASAQSKDRWSPAIRYSEWSDAPDTPREKKKISIRLRLHVKVQFVSPRKLPGWNKTICCSNCSAKGRPLLPEMIIGDPAEAPCRKPSVVRHHSLSSSSFDCKSSKMTPEALL